MKRKNCVRDKSALELTEKLVLVNPDVYTLWNYRKEILIDLKAKDQVDEASEGNNKPQSIGCSIKQLSENELTLTQNCLMKQPKSYPVWHHRYWVITCLIDEPDYIGELQLCKEALTHDSRNFHCWDYRKSISHLAKLPLMEEIDFTRRKICENFSNFSSWYVRSCLLTDAHARGELNMEKLWDEEYSFVENALFTDPTDQSAWFYHKWLSSINLGRQFNASPLRDELSMRLVICSPGDNLFAVKYNRATDSCPPFKVTVQPSACVYSSQQIMKCNSVINSYKQNIWTASRELIDLSLAQSIEITCPGIDSCLLIPLKKDTTVVAKSHQPSPALDTFKSRNLKEENMRSLRELHQLEPESKWINLTLSFFGDMEGKLNTLDKLCEIDPLRGNYYRDHKSRLIVHSKLDSPCKVEQSFHLNLSHCGISSLLCTERMMHLRSIDLSNNKLTHLSRSFSVLVALEVLILDSNVISCIDREAFLPSLRVLSLQNNQISHVEQLNNLIVGEKLDHVYLFGNRLLDDIDGDTLKCTFPFVSLEPVGSFSTLFNARTGEISQIDF